MKYIKHYIDETERLTDNSNALLNVVGNDPKINYQYDKPYEMLLIYNDGHAVSYQLEDMHGVGTIVEEPENVVEAIFNTEAPNVTGNYEGAYDEVFISKLPNLTKITCYKLSARTILNITGNCFRLESTPNIKVLDLRTLNYKDINLYIMVQKCEGIEEVYLPNNITLQKGNIGNTSTFFGHKCPNLKKVVFGDNITIHSNTAQKFSLYGSDVEEVIFGNNIDKDLPKTTCYGAPPELLPFRDKLTGEGYFLRECDYLKKVVLPNNMKGINANFFHQTHIKELEFPDSLRSIDIAIGGRIENIRIPNNIENIGYNCFNTKYTKSISFKTSSKKVSNNGRYRIKGNCIIEDIAHYLIKGCANSIIPDSVLILGLYSLSSIISNIFTIPSNIKEIKAGCFDYANINYLIFEGTVPPTLECNIPVTIKNIVVPADALETYKTATNWVNYANKIIAPTNTILTLEDDSKVTITGTALTKEQISDVYAATLKSVSIGIGVTSIGNKTFKDCTKLNHLEGGETVKSISNNAFENCSNLHDYKSFDSLESLGSNVFAGILSGSLNLSGLVLCSVKDNTFPSTWYNIPWDPGIVVNPDIVDEYKADPIWSKFGNYLNPVFTDTIINSLNLGHSRNDITAEDVSDINTITNITIGNQIGAIDDIFGRKEVRCDYITIPKTVDFVNFGTPTSSNCNTLIIKNNPSDDVFIKTDVLKFIRIKLYVTNPAEVGSNVISMLKDNGTLQVPREGYKAFKEAFPNNTVEHFNPNIE